MKMRRYGKVATVVAILAIPCVFFCINDSPDVVWELRAGSWIMSTAHPYNGKLYFLYTTAVVEVDANLDTNKETWRYEHSRHTATVPSGLTIYDGIALFVASTDAKGDTLFAVDLDTHRRLWERKVFVLDAFARIPVANDTAYVAASDTEVVALNIRTGDVEWSCEAGDLVKEQTRTVFLRPLAAVDGIVFVGFYEPRLYRKETGVAGIVAVSEKSRATLWTHATDQEVGVPAYCDGRAYLCCRDGVVKCLGGEDGEEVWSYKAGPFCNMTPAVCGDKVFVGSQDSYLYVLKKKSGELLRTSCVKGDIESNLLRHGERVYYGTDTGWLYAHDARTGGVVWSKYIGGEIDYPPSVHGNTLYVATRIVGAEGGKRWKSVLYALAVERRE